MAYSDEEKIKIFDDICEKIIEGKSLRTALKELSDFPAKTFFVWLREDEDKSKQYARATEERAELMFEDMFDIADDGTNDWMEKTNEKGENVGWSVNGENIQRSRVRIDVRKWALSKMQPKKYGDKLDITSKDEKLQQNIIVSSIEQKKIVDELLKKE
jgi:hypothetical protein